MGLGYIGANYYHFRCVIGGREKRMDEAFVFPEFALMGLGRRDVLLCRGFIYMSIVEASGIIH